MEEFKIIALSLATFAAIVVAAMSVHEFYRHQNIKAIVEHAPQLTVTEAKEMLEIIERKH